MTGREEPSLGVAVAGIEMRNPVITASGTFGYGREYAALIPLAELGAVVVKGTSLAPRPGNPPPRTVETASGVLNSIGLENPGVEHFISRDLPWLAAQRVPVVVNVVGRTVEEYVEMARRLDGAPGLRAIEANISCPNVKEGGLAFGADPRAAAALTAGMRQATSLPLIVKLTPNVTDIAGLARAVVEAGADAVSLINTLVGMAIDPVARRPILHRGIGGLSGPAVKPVALAAVYRVAGAVTVPVIGMGGIWSGRDAVEFIMAGASAVAIGTAVFVDPRRPLGVIAEIREFMINHGHRRVSDMVGLANATFAGRRPMSRMPDEGVRS